MKPGIDTSGIIAFAERPPCAARLSAVLTEHIEPALEELHISTDQLEAALGDQWGGMLWGCAFEDLLTVVLAPDGENIVDDYLERRGWKENQATKAYLQGLRDSVMSLYEVSGIVPEAEPGLMQAFLDQYYRKVLDEPVPMLGGITPRQAVMTDEGRRNAVDWLKWLENQDSRRPVSNDTAAGYDFSWMWRELGIEDLRR